MSLRRADSSGHEAVVPGAIRRLCEVVPGPVLIEPVEGGGELAQRGLILARSLVERIKRYRRCECLT